AAAGRGDAQALARLEADAHHLRGHRRLAPAVALLVDEAVLGRVAAAADAARRKPPALGEEERLGLALERRHLVNAAEAAAMAAGPAAVRAQRPLREHHRIGGFEDLHRRDRRGGDRRVAVVESVALGVPAMAAAE